MRRDDFLWLLTVLPPGQAHPRDPDMEHLGKFMKVLRRCSATNCSEADAWSYQEREPIASTDDWQAIVQRRFRDTSRCRRTDR